MRPQEACLLMKTKCCAEFVPRLLLFCSLESDLGQLTRNVSSMPDGLDLDPLSRRVPRSRALPLRVAQLLQKTPQIIA